MRRRPSGICSVRVEGVKKKKKAILTPAPIPIPIPIGCTWEQAVVGTFETTALGAGDLLWWIGMCDSEPEPEESLFHPGRDPVPRQASQSWERRSKTNAVTIPGGTTGI